MEMKNVYICALFATFAAQAAAAEAPQAQTITADGGEKSLSQTWAVAADARVEVNNVRGRVAVSGWDQPQVQLSGNLGGGSALDVSGDAQHLTLRVKGTHNGWFGGNGPDSDSDLVLKVPRGAELKVGVVSADANVSGVNGRSLDVNGVSGKLTLTSDASQIDVNSVSGDVVFSGSPAKAAGARAHLQTVSGEITAHGLAGRIKLETVSGDIVMDGGNVDELETGTVSGDAKLDITPTSHARFALESMSGDIHLTVPSVSGHVEAKTFSGDITSDFGKPRGREHGSGSSLDAHVGDGDAQIRAETFSGDIQLRQR